MEANTTPEMAAPGSITCSVCDTGFDNEHAFIQHSQQMHPHIDGYQLENAPEKIKKPTVKQAKIEVFHFETNGESSSEAEIVTDGINIEDQVVLAIHEEDELIVENLPIRTTRAASSKLKNESKAKRTRLSEKPTTSKVIFKTEISDYDENVDINDDYEFEPTGSESLNFYECPLCSTQFADRKEYIEHCKEHDDSEYQCDGCNKLFEDEEQLLQHDCEMNDVNEEDLMCIPCNKRMKSTAQLRQHSKMHDSMSMIIDYLDFFPCHDCYLLFISKDKLNEHNATSHPEKNIKESPEISEEIDESCTDYQFLDDDKSTEYKEGEVYSCGECNQSYQTVTELKYHVILHANKFECPIEECGCQYDQMTRLSIHVLNKHINTKNMQCLHCNQQFTTYDDLQNHLKHFCKEKKFKCYECGKNQII